MNPAHDGAPDPWPGSGGEATLSGATLSGATLSGAATSEAAAAPWLDLVGAPMLLLGGSGVSVIKANEAFRLLLNGEALPGFPCPLASVLGETVERELRAMVGAMQPGLFTSPLVADCRIGGALRRYTLQVAALRDPRDHWLITLLEPPGAPRQSWEQDVEAILSWLPIGVEILDDKFASVYANVCLTQLFGYDGEEVRHLDDWLVRAFPDPAYRARAVEEWNSSLAEIKAGRRDTLLLEWDIVCKDGSRKAIQYRYRAFGGSSLGVYRDISRERELQAELRRLAETDALTGLHSRRYFFDSATAWFEAARADDAPLAVLLLDLDHFKLVNDRHGHAVGDRVLQAAAACLRRMLRQDDLLARVGGEEFGVLLKGASQAAAECVAERLRLAIAAEPMAIGELGISLTVSVGAAVALPGDAQVAAAIERADQALYAAKRAGRNRTCFGSGGSEAGAPRGA